MWIKIKNNLFNLDNLYFIQFFEDRVYGTTVCGREVKLDEGETAKETYKNLMETLYMQELGEHKCVECSRATADYTFTENEQGMMERLPICSECYNILLAEQKGTKPKIQVVKGGIPS